MDRIIKAVKAGVRAMHEDLGPREYAAGGRQVRCVHCAGTSFRSRDLLLDGRAATLAGVEWLSDGAVALVCADCTGIQWFAGRPTEIES
ncbi:MAG TPA: hypothetical protein VEA99_11965 [Gemmatimonadaceae bacterium]|nr:hypothetical protein [Gemmatimonadaceae bacterium]